MKKLHGFQYTRVGWWLSGVRQRLTAGLRNRLRRFLGLEWPRLRTVRVHSGKLQRSNPAAAGWDIFADEDVLLAPGERYTVSTGLHLEMYGCFGLIRDRSGRAGKEGLTTRAGVIDEDYTGEVKVVVVNENDPEGRWVYKDGKKLWLDEVVNIVITKGERIAQILFFPSNDIAVLGTKSWLGSSGGEAVTVSDGLRGGNGFGSTGNS